MKKPTRITITGAAGQISYSLLFRIAAGEMLGDDQPVILQLLEIPVERVQQILQGTVMELEDCAFPLLHSLLVTSDPNVAFRDADVALLVGAKPRGRDMERKDLIQVNAPILAEHGRALNEVASRDVKVLVVGNPANTNALIAMKNAPDIALTQFTSMMRLDHNRSVTQIARKTARPVTAVRRMTVWGNHSGTQYPDLSNVEIDGTNLVKLIDDPEWIEGTFIPTVQKRGESIIAARGGSSAASAASAALDHVRDWVQGTRSGDWVSMGVPADGSYGVSEGVIFGFPVVCSGGEYEIVKGLDLAEFSKEKISATHTELLDERAAVEQLMG